MKALLCVVMDRSGSMGGKEDDVIGGVNRFIQDQRKEPGEARLTLVRFDTEYEQIYHDVPIEGARLLTPADYIPRGGTALLDSIGRTICALDAACAINFPDKVIVVVVTDGQENQSREYKLDRIKSMISEREKSGRWSFIYLGASASAFSDATSMGFQFANAAKYTDTKMGTQAVYAEACASVSNLRAGAQTGNLGRAIGESISPDAQKNSPQWQPVSK